MSAHKTQRDCIKAALLRRELVNQVTAAQRFNTFRLAPIIQRIRRRDGWPVESHPQKPGGLVDYRLPLDWTPPTPSNGEPTP